MTIEDTIWLLAHSTHPEDRREWAVLYWKAQGLKHIEIADRFHYSEQWVQRYMTRAYERFGVPKKLDKYQKLKILEETVFPKIREFIAGNPDTLKELPPPPVEDPDEPEDTSPIQVRPNKPTIIIDPRPPKTPLPVRFLRYLIFGIVACGAIGGIAYYAYRTGVGNSPTPMPTQAETIIPPQNTEAPTGIPATQVIPPPSASVLSTDTPQPAPTDTLLPTTTPFVPPSDGIMFQDNFDSGYSPSLKVLTGNWITANGRLTLVFEDYIFMWLKLDAPVSQNYRIEVNINKPGGQVLVAVRDRSLAYYVGYYGANCWAFVDSTKPNCIVGTADEKFSKLNLELDVQNNEFVAIVDGTEIQRITMNGKPEGGIELGIYCQRGFECPSVDNFKVTYLP